MPIPEPPAPPLASPAAVRSRRGAWLLRALALSLPAAAVAQSAVLLSRHNLSVTGPGSVRSATESQVCIFCHLGHAGRGLGLNRPDSTAAHIPYASSTMLSRPGAPTSASRVCLSCHDGTIAIGMTLGSGFLPVQGTDGAGALPSDRPSRLGTDLRRTHPVSFVPSPSAEVRDPPPLDAVRLDRGGELQCTSCHDPHREDADPVERKFLVKPNRSSALCTTCHAKPQWTSAPAAHATSPATVTPSSIPGLAYPTVTENGCASCHRQHHADPAGRLTRPTADGTGQRLCLACHDGTVARLDLTADLAKLHAHREAAGARIHDAAEGPENPAAPLPETSSSAPRHVTCVDCHDPHAARKQAEPAPRADGTLQGAWGIDRTGQRVSPAHHQYEVCFKCHADSQNQPGASGTVPAGWPRRAVNDVNLRRVFDPNAASFHPVEGQGKGTDVPSLRPPLTTASVILCTDCHASDQGPAAGGSGPAGPHGSVHPFLLERRYATLAGTPYAEAEYALCFKCHLPEVILDPARSGFPMHQRHLVTASATCSACHDGHGVSALAGNPTNNAHLVDFDVDVVSADAGGLRRYVSTGYRSGSCNLSCHGTEHAPKGYDASGPVAARTFAGRPLGAEAVRRAPVPAPSPAEPGRRGRPGAEREPRPAGDGGRGPGARVRER